MLIELTDKTFENFIAKGQTLIMMTTSWCPLCKRGEKAMSELCYKHIHLKVARIDVQQNTEILMRYAPNGLPYFILYEDGYSVMRHKGLPLDVFDEYLKEHK